MPNHEEIMSHIFTLVGEGAGMALPDEIRAALKRRYHQWIVEKKKGMTTSPLDIWEAKEGMAIQERVREVGRELKKKNGALVLSQAEFRACCLQVESTSECPHCPDPPGA
jgi:predicted Zn-ribbon and HTH transcriptional regulator